MMDLTGTLRQGDTDGRGNLSEKSLSEFTRWFLKVCLEQVTFMTGLFEIHRLGQRLKSCVDRHNKLKPESVLLLEEVLIRGEISVAKSGECWHAGSFGTARADRCH